MANSVLNQRGGPEWPLGVVVVANNGTPVSIMTNVDANNVNAPGSASNNLTSEYTTTCRAIWFTGMHQDANNNMQPNTGNVYVLVPPSANGSGNKSDAGCMVMVVAPGVTAPLPLSLASDVRFSPYRYKIDADVNGDGALVVLIGPQGQ